MIRFTGIIFGSSSIKYFMYDMLAWLYWNPERTAFTVPILNHPVVWYGLWFVLGFIIGYMILIPLFRYQIQKTPFISIRDIANWDELVKILNSRPPNTQMPLKQLDKQHPLPHTKILEAINELKWTRRQVEEYFAGAIYSSKHLAYMLVDQLTWFVVAGTVIGARLGHVLFYDLPRYKNDPLSIFKVWEGGLASHGGAIGVLIGLYFYQKMIKKQNPEFSFIVILDLIVVPTAFTAFCIRMGNFFNQEILGYSTNVPWGIIFGDPIDGGAIVPRHPVQLYEAFAYLGIFIFLWFYWRQKREVLKKGTLSGLFFILIFGSRFLIEFFKTPQSLIFHETVLQTGQYLSIPFIALGFFLLFWNFDKQPKEFSK